MISPFGNAIATLSESVSADNEAAAPCTVATRFPEDIDSAIAGSDVVIASPERRTGAVAFGEV
ncbi:MAG: hypothetical protein EBT17_03885 [Actinobacteria bacterium]|jgi:hypothetical protein|nr:hypothetical protein [Actinomycetota bacterium]NBY57197.1 hypothetical protein [Actinomycetota bacterium]